MTRAKPYLVALAVTLLLGACSRTPTIDVELSATVGLAPDVCASSTALDVDDRRETTVYYCYTITNVGSTTATLHSLSDELFGEILSDFAFDLAPGASIDTVTAGIVLERVVTADLGNAATWTASAPGVASVAVDAASQVNVVEPWRYAAVVGTMVAGGTNVADFAGNVVYLGIRHRSGVPIDGSTDVAITLPDGATRTITFDPAAAAGGTTIAVVADFAQAAAAARLLDVPVVAWGEAGTVASQAVQGGEFTIAFVGATLQRSVDASAALDVPEVTEATIGAARTSVTVAFTASEGAMHRVDAYGASPNGFSGSTSSASSPVTVALSGVLGQGELVVIDVLAYRNRVEDVFLAQGQADLAAYVHVGN
jgi:hypothetical protein